MTVIEELQSNQCTYCLEQKIENGSYVDVKWRGEKNNGYWPKPYQEQGLDPDKVKAIVIGQDPTIKIPRSMEYVLEANKAESKLGQFLREVFSMLPGINFNELYFTNLIKCRFKEKPGKGGRDISIFLSDMASQCYSRFLKTEIEMFQNAQYIFTLGRDNFSILAELLGVSHPPLPRFKEFYGTKLAITVSEIGRTCYLIPLPHQPTYDLAKRDSIYQKEEVRRRLRKL